MKVNYTILTTWRIHKEKKKKKKASQNKFHDQSTVNIYRSENETHAKQNSDRLNENLTGKHPNNYPFLRSAREIRPWRRYSGTLVRLMVFHRYLLCLPQPGIWISSAATWSISLSLWNEKLLTRFLRSEKKLILPTTKAIGCYSLTITWKSQSHIQPLNGP